MRNESSEKKPVKRQTSKPQVEEKDIDDFTLKEELISELTELAESKKHSITLKELDLDLVVEAHFTDKSQIFPLSIFSLSEDGASASYKNSDLEQWERLEIPALSMKQIWRTFLDENPLFVKQLSSTGFTEEEAYSKFLKAIQGESDKDGLFPYPFDCSFFENLFRQEFGKILTSKTIIAAEDASENPKVFDALLRIFGESNVLKFDEEKIKKKEKEDLDKRLGKLANHPVLVLAQFLQDLPKEIAFLFRKELKKYEEIVEFYEEVKSRDRTINEFESNLKSIDINPQEFVPILDALKSDEKKKRLMQILEVEEVHPKVGGVVRDKDLKFWDVVNAVAPMRTTWLISEVAQTGYRHRDYSLKKARVYVTEKRTRAPFTKISFVIALLVSSAFLVYLFQYIKLSGWSIAGLIIGGIILIVGWSKIVNKEKGWGWNLGWGFLFLFIAKPQIGLSLLPIPLSWFIVKQIFSRRRGNWLLTVLLPLIFSIIGGGSAIAWTYNAMSVTVNISSIPSGGSLRINGYPVGKTPVRHKLKPGRHTIRIAEIQGYEPIEQTIEVSREGKTFFEFPLRRLAIGKITVSEDFLSVRNGPSKYYTEIAKVRRGTKLELLNTQKDWNEVRLPDGREGWIYREFTERVKLPGETVTTPVSVNFSSTPSGAYVYIDDSYKGRTPLQVLLKPGNYSVNVGGISGYRNSQKTIKVSTTGSNEFYFPLKEEEEERPPPPPSLVKIRINSNPTGADVYINGVYKGKTLLRVDLKPGRYLIDLNLSGYQPIKGRVISVSEEGDKYFNFSLESVRIKIPAPPPRRGR